MKRILAILTILILFTSAVGCRSEQPVQIAATTLPVYDFAMRICEGTDLKVGRIVTQSVSCLHDYTLQVNQMRCIEGADVLILSGAGLEDFLDDALNGAKAVIDASSSVELICHGDAHEEEHHHGHSHESDPHIWLAPKNAKTMAANICRQLCSLYPQHSALFEENLSELTDDLNTLQQYGNDQLSNLNCRELITFHDGFAYFAEAFDLTILEAVEEESGSEASAAELIDLAKLITNHHLPAIFTERNASASAATILKQETGCNIFMLDMAMTGDSYFEAMYRNIDTIKEALG